ncbi:radial spoke head 1 homolog [Fopius arisanus]|uniref:Radial spoke head 1 homolog n=1 Tax=Fopius arisanus TaxID=64838 RepID=A0A9R1TUI0_9HYME|nr:PREDICTED: radial spoke head 1 homolog [Fopius arisanus]
MAEKLQGEEEEDVNLMGVYEGERNSNGLRHGKGKYQFPNGDIYIGEYCRGSRNNQGVYIFKNGARYDGEWRSGLKYGRGTFLYPDGTRYEGEWKRDERCGFGVYYYLNKDIYEGAWRNNLRHGLGSYHFSESSVKFMGIWINDGLQGPGHIIYPRYHFRGTWKHNLPFGQGCFTFENNCMQHGDYVHRNCEGDVMTQNNESQLGDAFSCIQSGVSSLWCARYITSYNPDLLPLEAKPLHEQMIDNDSLTDECHKEVSNVESDTFLPLSSETENDAIDYQEEFLGET